VKRGGVTFYQSREVLLPIGPGKMAPWRKELFVALSRISAQPPVTSTFLPAKSLSSEFNWRCSLPKLVLAPSFRAAAPIVPWQP